MILMTVVPHDAVKMSQEFSIVSLDVTLDCSSRKLFKWHPSHSDYDHQSLHRLFYSLKMKEEKSGPELKRFCVDSGFFFYLAQRV